MRVAFLSDVHANLIALEAVLTAIKKHHPERIISLGDQVNLGPCPKETLELLKSEGVTCLHGNHERYVLSAMAGDPQYREANYESVRFTAERVTQQEITFPKTLELPGSVICTHAMPDNDRFHVHHVETAFPVLAEMKLYPYRHIICGHGHNPTYYLFDRMTVHSIGSAGCMDDGIPGTAQYVIGEIDERGMALRPYYAQYDVKRIRPLFLSSGMADDCPIIARIICMQMTHNRDFLVSFVNHAFALAKTKGETHMSEETWAQADATYPWADGLTAPAFWKQHRFAGR